VRKYIVFEMKMRLKTWKECQERRRIIIKDQFQKYCIKEQANGINAQTDTELLDESYYESEF